MVSYTSNISGDDICTSVGLCVALQTMGSMDAPSGICMYPKCAACSIQGLIGSHALEPST